MSVKVIISGNHTEKTIERFKKLNADVVFVPSLADADPKDLAEAEIVAGGVNPQLLEKMPKLRFVQLFSAGANSYGWLPEQITLANAYGAYGESIAEHMLTTTLMAMKRMPEYLDMQKEQGWNLLRDIDRFAGSNILSVGMGAIGTAYLKKADALGAVCYGVRRSVHDKPELN